MTCIICSGHDFEEVFFRQGYRFVRCSSCGVMRLDPIPDVQVLQRHYATRTADGNYDLRISRQRDESIAETLDFVVKQTGERGALKLMDIGCFDGKLLDLAVDRLGWECWGIDINQEAVKAAKTRHGSRVSCTTIEDYAPPCNLRFDVITAIAVIEHLREPQRLLAKIASWLAEGGTCILELPNADSLPARALGRYWPLVAAPEHIWYFGPRHIAKLAEDVGLKYIKWERHWKKLSIAYVYYQLEFFGPEIRKVASTIMKVLPSSAQNRRLYFYGGEMHIVISK
jgi:2-polyprenyl-3-methyl-5-hydroxy-6-metoxy-1,4-benzoquinol methylase